MWPHSLLGAFVLRVWHVRADASSPSTLSEFKDISCTKSTTPAVCELDHHRSASAASRQRELPPDAPSGCPKELVGDVLLRQERLVPTHEALKDKQLIMFYFGANWCPHCLQFTKELASRYNVSAASNGIEVVFMSSDENVHAFETYYKDMPWLAMPFGQFKRRDDLRRAHGISGIPVLLVYDVAGNLVTAQGREEVHTFLPGGGFPKLVLDSPVLLEKDRLVTKDSSLNGKSNVMLYFSASWCKHCQEFTPELKKRYEASAKDKNVQIVFVSLDQSVADFEKYYEEMPWLAVPFGQFDQKRNLTMEHVIQGIPSLLVFDADGGLITTQGTVEVNKYLPSGGPDTPSVSALLGDVLIKKSAFINTDVALTDRNYVMLYFSAGWCQHCKDFTPQLARRYRDSAKEKGVEVIFVSDDESVAAFEKYYDDMPWLALPYGQFDRKLTIGKEHQITALPTLLIFTGNGTLITDQGRIELYKYLPYAGKESPALGPTSTVETCLLNGTLNGPATMQRRCG